MPVPVPQDPSGRIDFQFDEAGFDLKALPFNIPYPVPFRLFGDEVWLAVCSCLLHIEVFFLCVSSTFVCGP